MMEQIISGLTVRTFLSGLLIAIGLGLAAANPTFFGLSAVTGAVSPITCTGTCWTTTTCSNAVSCTPAASSAQTITVPSGNAGTLLFHSIHAYTMQYSDNGAAFTTIADGGTYTITTGHTLAIKVLSINSGPDSETVTITDNTTGAAVGTYTGQNTHA